MARTPSTMLELGTAAPEFSLIEPATGKRFSLTDFKDKPLLVAFICNHCPFVIHLRDAFNAFTRKYQKKGLAVVAINANDAANYPEDSPEKMAAYVDTYEFAFPYLFDETQDTAKAYQAACTPDFFLFDASHKLFYRGQFDASRPGNDLTVTGEDMVAAVNALLAGNPAPEKQLASLGCNIKWKPGNEPDYFG